jgi:hypothetical protein
MIDGAPVAERRTVSAPLSVYLSASLVVTGMLALRSLGITIQLRTSVTQMADSVLGATRREVS